MSNNTSKLVAKLWTKVGASGSNFKTAALSKFKRSVSAWFVLNIGNEVNEGRLGRDDAIKRLKQCPSTGDVKALTLLDATLEFIEAEGKIDLDAVQKHEEAEGRQVVNGKPVFAAITTGTGDAMSKPVTNDDKAEKNLHDKIAKARAIPFKYVVDGRHAAQVYANMWDGAVIMFVGPPGCGKTSLAHHLAAKKGRERPVFRVQMNDNSTDQTLLGSKTISRESVPTGEYAKFLVATRRLEEAIATGSEEAIEVANQMLAAVCTIVEDGENGRTVYPPVEEYVEVPKMQWQDGPVIQAMQVGVDRETGEVIEGAHAAVLIVDEFEAGPAGTMMVMQGLMERPDMEKDGRPGRRTLVVAEDGGRVVKAHPDFTIILTGNTYGYGDMTGKYQRNVQDSSNLNRVDATFTFEFPDIKKVFEKAALPDFVGRMEKFFKLVQDGIKKGTLQIDFGLRRLYALVRQLHLCGDFKEALRVTCLNPLGEPTTHEYQTVKGHAEQAFGADYQYRN